MPTYYSCEMSQYKSKLCILGADASPKLNKDDYTPLHSAAYQKDTRIARLLVQHKANVNAK